ncbi:hypothetical protein BCR42DRAFT_411382 [Absidia repens]|uniref:Uncharacterized protein n=1 Tax=Absidia repens TaxID=90262 RepID=A0A1X2ILK0_9FUNG|nr:hypothetical protein BCR42DRAFT_411382 [Absidia repens]
MHTNNFIDGSSSMTVDRKRKRRGTLQVRFCTEPCEIIDTHSPLDYDRGGLFPNVSHDDQSNNTYANSNIILTLSFGFVAPSSSCHSPPPTTPLPPPQQQQQQQHSVSSSNLMMKKPRADKKRPKLSIDTSNIHDGPLYFTSMTTNHQKKEQQQQKLNVEDDHDARITMENTEMNRRCLVAAA